MEKSAPPPSAAPRTEKGAEPQNVAPTGAVYTMYFKLGDAEPLSDGGQPLAAQFYQSEIDIDPKGPNKNDQLVEHFRDLVVDGFVKPGEPFINDIENIFLGVPQEVAVQAVKDYVAWLNRHRELPLISKYREFYDWNWDHLDEMRASLKAWDPLRVRAFMILSNHIGSLRAIHMIGKVISELLNGKTRQQIADFVGRVPELTDEQVEAVKQDIYAGRSVPSAATGLSL